MRRSVGAKIYGVLVLILIAMAMVTGTALLLTGRISDELEDISHRLLPLSDAVARINTLVLAQMLTVERLEGLDASRDAGARDSKAMKTLDGTIEETFAKARFFLVSPGGGRTTGERFHLETELDEVKAAYESFRRHAEMLVEARKNGGAASIAFLSPELNRLQAEVDGMVAAFRRETEAVVDKRVAQADRDEKVLLLVNLLLALLAAVVGFGTAHMVIRGILRSVGNLVFGTQAVESGQLDVTVPITSKDEIGRLTGSFNNMVGELRLKERIKDTFGKYMDPRVVTHLLDSPEVAEPGGERREMTVMFIDLQDFTTLSEKLPPDRLVETVNRFFTHMTEAISTNGGVVDKFMGDAVMAFWGAPFTGPDEHAALACRAAAAALEGLGKLRSDAGISDIDFRIGISSGEVIVGTIGSETSRSYTVMGDTVNLGSRLEGANKAYGTHVIMSERTRELAGDGFPIRELDLIRVKGKTEPTRIHQLLGNKLEPQGFQEGLKAYRNQDWEAATRVFETCLTEVPDDPPSRVYLDRVAHLKAHPPERDWNGVWVFSAK